MGQRITKILHLCDKVLLNTIKREIREKFVFSPHFFLTVPCYILIETLMLHFKKSTLIDSPVDRVWQLIESPDISAKLIAPWQPVTILGQDRVLAVGGITKYRINLVLTQVDWSEQYTQCEKPNLLTSIQIKGPMQFWQHDHQFTSVGDKTLVTDSIDYQISDLWLVDFFLAEWVNSRLEDMFKYRHQVIQQECR